MKLILTQEVTGLGAPGDIVEVKDGYGRNYLIPRNVAVRWTRGGQKQVDSIKAARASRSVRDQTHADEIKAKLEAGPVDVKVRSGANGRLFGTVTIADLAGALAEVSGELPLGTRQCQVVAAGTGELRTGRTLAERAVVPRPPDQPGQDRAAAATRREVRGQGTGKILPGSAGVLLLTSVLSPVPSDPHLDRRVPRERPAQPSLAPPSTYSVWPVM